MYINIRVPEGDGVEQGGQVVVAVRPPPDDAQEEVDLRRGEELHGGT